MTSWPSWQTALQHYEWVGILIARLSVGTLFVLSGSGKLFVPSRRDAMVQTLRAAGIPAPATNALVVSAVEFVFGLLVVVGLLMPLSCLMLSGVMIVALATVILPGVHATSFAGWLSSVLYLPEVLYLVILVWLFFSGAGWVSVDYVISGQSAHSKPHLSAVMTCANHRAASLLPHMVRAGDFPGRVSGMSDSKGC